MSKMTDWQALLNRFGLEGELITVEPYGSGHINDTYRVVMRTEKGEEWYILQRMNDRIFTNPSQLMENVLNVTTFLQEKIAKQGGNPKRETLNVIKSKTGDAYVVDHLTGYWRMYRFIMDATSYDKVEKPEDFYQSAVAFGHFQNLLSDYPAETLHETIPNFHNTPVRFETFKKAVADDVCQRAASVQEEIQFVLDREADTHVLMDMLESGELPLRVTHNDTKLNNIMIDNATGKGEYMQWRKRGDLSGEKQKIKL